MGGYLVPFETAESIFTEKRSRFIGKIWRVNSEAEAKTHIEETKKKYCDARHHCWCYMIWDSGIIRYSDDGEPQGTAGQPILNVFQHREINNVCCVVTRYFGGVLLGAGGLTRAYSRSAKDTLVLSGVCRMSLWSCWKIPCTYSLLERVKQEIIACGGTIRDAEYGESILLRAAFPAGEAERFLPRLTELSSGVLSMHPDGELVLPGPREEVGSVG
jgi:uncharacterized YigZ family protein